MGIDLAEVARDADAVTTRARADLVSAVRQAAADGMSQTQIARQIGRSQPEVSRLLHSMARPRCHTGCDVTLRGSAALSLMLAVRG